MKEKGTEETSCGDGEDPIRSHCSLEFLWEKLLQCTVELYENTVGRQLDNWYGSQTKHTHQEEPAHSDQIFDYNQTNYYIAYNIPVSILSTLRNEAKR